MATMNNPIYITEDPKVYADQQRQRLLDLGCSEEYAEARKQEILDRAVQVKFGFESNAMQKGARDAA